MRHARVAPVAHGRLLRLVQAAVLLALGCLVWVTAADAAPSVLRPQSGAKALTRAERSSSHLPGGGGGVTPGAPRAIPLRSPESARLLRVKRREAGRAATSGTGPSPRALFPAPAAVLFNGLNKPGMAASALSPTPPDTTGAIGPNNYVEFVNGIGITAYDRNLNHVAGPVALEDFIGYPADSVFDPQIQWDAAWGRWIYAMDDIEDPEHNYLAFGWSKTADPTSISTEPGGGWCGYFIPTGELFDDYPKLGHSDAGLTIGTNVFTTSFLGSRLWSIAKPANPASCPVLGGETIASTGALLTEDGELAFTPVPANPAGGTANSYVVAADFPGGEPADQIMAWHLTGAGGGATLFADGNIDVGGYDFPANVPQPGTGEVIDSMDTRLTNAVAAVDPAAGREAVWTQHTVAGSGGRSAVRWYELLPGTRTLRQEGTISDPSQFVFNAAISPTAQGDAAAIDFNRGSASLFPDMHARSRDSAVPLGTMENDVLLGTSAGAAVDFSCGGALEPCRWGDYAGASPDPVQPGVVWGSNQGLAAPSGESARWTTRNFALLADDHAPPAPTISGTEPASPANENSPKVKGSAEAGSTVRVYESSACTGAVAAEGSAASFGSSGLAVTVADNTTVSLSATATDAAGNTSPCSAPGSYTESTPPPAKRGTAFAARIARVKHGKALVKLSCRGGGDCKGVVKLIARVKLRNGKRRNVQIGKRSFSIAAGKAKVVRVRLTNRGRALVRHAGKRGLKVKLRGSGVRNRTVLLR